MPKYLDSTGLGYFWGKIKNKIAAEVNTCIKKGSNLFTTNPFAPDSMGSESLYVSKIDNALYAADKRFDVTCTIGGSPIGSSKRAKLFDGNYEDGPGIYNGDTAVITLDFTNQPDSKFPNYPYGYVYISFYYVCKPASISARAYNNYTLQGVGWHDLKMEVVSNNASQQIYRFRQSYYGLQTLEITIVGDTTNSYGFTIPVQIEMWLDRPNPARTPFVNKYVAETLYYQLTAPNFNGKINNHIVNKDVPENAIFTDTTYSPMTQAQATAGTSTDGMLISPKVLIDTIGSNVTVVVEDNKIKITSR